MRKLAASVLLALSLVAGSALGAETPPTQEPGDSADGAICEQLKSEGATPEQLAQQGCCSWHGGVCGCNNGRKVCCDGTYSPSCTC